MGRRFSGLALPGRRMVSVVLMQVKIILRKPLKTVNRKESLYGFPAPFLAFAEYQSILRVMYIIAARAANTRRLPITRA